MRGILIGDFVGSAYEGTDFRGYTLPLIQSRSQLTDDSIIALATADTLFSEDTSERAFARSYRRWGRGCPGLGYGPGFEAWLASDEVDSGSSDGNGAAIRAAVIAMLTSSIEEAMPLLARAVRITHSEEALEIAQAVVTAIHGARSGESYETIREKIILSSFIDIEVDLDALHEEASFSVLMENTVPHALHIGLSALDSEDALRQTLYVGGDTDTVAAIAGAIIDARGLHWDTELVERSEFALKQLPMAKHAERILHKMLARIDRPSPIPA